MTRKRAALTVNVNNRGTALLGRTAVVAHASLYNVVREGEQIGFSFATATSTGRYRFAGLDVSEAIGDDGTQLALNAGYLRTKPLGQIGRGEAETASLSLTHPLVLTASDSLVLSGTIAGLDSTNALFGARAADERVRAIRAGATYSVQSPTYAVSLAGTASFGLDALGARASSLVATVPGFRKLSVRVAYTQVLDEVLVLRFHSAAQYAFERLPVSEFLPLGGSDFGRSFAAAVISGDHAVAGSVELALRPKLNIEQLGDTELYGYLDGGETWTLARGAAPAATDSLQSGGVGLRSTFLGKLAAELEVGRGLHAPRSSHGSWQVDFSTTLIAP